MHEPGGEMKSQKTRVPHEASAFSEDLSKRLAAYALAATAAAGVGLMGASTPAQGAIIVHPARLSILCSATSSLGRFGSAHGNLNIVGAIHLSFVENCFFPPLGPSAGSLHVSAKGANVATFPGYLAARFEPGDPIGPADVFGQTSSGGKHFAGGLMSRFSGPRSFGNWPNEQGYLGFDFSSHGKHFGWAAATVREAPLRLYISEYAYDTVAGQAIRAGQTSAVPEPGTLALLALGAAGLAALRRRKHSAVSHHESAV
jgi:hypothetical protein